MQLHTVLCFCIISLILFAPTCAEEDCRDNNDHNIDIDLRVEMTDDYFTAVIRPYLLREFRPWSYFAAPYNLEATGKTDVGKSEFDIDVQHFAPSEVSVNVENGYVVVEAKHDEKKDEHGFISRHIVRRYSIPVGVDPKDVVAHLSSDGILTITARKPAQGNSGRPVPIVHTGPKRKQKDNTSCDNENNCNSNKM